MTGLVSIPPRTEAYATTISVRKGDIWVLLYCINGGVTVTVEGISKMPFNCPTGEIKPYAVQIEITEDQRLSVKAEPADANVVWSLTITQA